MSTNNLRVGATVRVTATPTAQPSDEAVAKTLQNCGGETATIIDTDGTGARTLYLIRMDSVKDPRTGDQFEWGTYADNIVRVDN